MISVIPHVIVVVILFGGPPFILTGPVTLARDAPDSPFLTDRMGVSIGILTIFVLAGTLPNHVVAIVLNRRVPLLDKMTLQYLESQLSVVLAGAVCDSSLRLQDSTPVVSRKRCSAALLAFVPSMVLLGVASALLLLPCLAMWLWVLIRGRVPGWWGRALPPVIVRMDRIAYFALTGRRIDYTLEVRPMADKTTPPMPLDTASPEPVAVF